MPIKHLLVHVDGVERSAPRLDLAVALARRFGARLTGLFAETISLGASIVARRSPQHLESAAREARSAFEARTGAAGVAAEWWELAPGDYADVVGATAICCRFADLVVFGQREDGDDRVPEDLTERVLLDCGRPVLVVPSAGHHVEVGKRVLVVWNASRDAARAVNDAIPLMQGAEEVEVLALRQASSAGLGRMPPLDIVAHLAAHGIRCRYDRVVKEELGDHPGVVDVLLNHAFDLRADLTVMGAGYQEYASPFLSRGRRTRELLRSMLTPVLLSH